MKKTKICLMNQKGQMTIFIALIFQVLFVFFAMIVNIGLIVHDKINLQNSVDLAAYYGAQRQAEMLNAIAHQNYQIRQAWKLLTWRVRVLGDLAYKYHPMQSQMGDVLPDVAAYVQGEGGSNATRIWRPTVCINHTYWGLNNDTCYNSNVVVPRLPITPTVAPIGPLGYLNVLTTTLTTGLQQSAQSSCESYGPTNFDMALRWMAAYRAQIARAKETIRLYADELSNGAEDFRDIRAESTKQGVFNTLANNLTRANVRGMQNDNFKFYNSLGQGNRKEWLREIPIYPIVLYTDFNAAAGCSATVKPIARNGGQSNLPIQRPVGTPEMNYVRNEPSSVDDLYHSVAGVEKNPWMMAYVAVYAETKPRKPYLPFGEPITLRARAYAKPFGGRIGPWFYAKWPEGSNKSAGTLDEKIDEMLPIPFDPDSGGLGASSEVDRAIPNYSRYPGDQLGLTSQAALVQFKRIIRAGNRLKPDFYSNVPAGDDGLAMANNQRFSASNNTSLALGYRGPWVRDVEVAAIAPDLFDVTYYSIDPDAHNNYTKPALDGGLIPQDKVPLDAGSFANNIVGIKKQIEIVENLTQSNSSQMKFYIINDVQHLLTGWAPSDAFQYDFPSQFGKCNDEGNLPVPGRCARGGRVGYSVKLISEDYLKSNELPLGGEGIKGKILNPPPF